MFPSADGFDSCELMLMLGALLLSFSTIIPHPCSSEMMTASPVTQVRFLQRFWHIKRDDLLHLSSNPMAISPTNGNKLRKFMYLLQLDESPKVIASHGGLQSNSMVALAGIADSLRASFHYFAHRIPQHFLTCPSGNYKLALELGMKLHSLEQAEYALLKDTPVLSDQANEMVKVFLLP